MIVNSDIQGKATDARFPALLSDVLAFWPGAGLPKPVNMVVGFIEWHGEASEVTERS